MGLFGKLGGMGRKAVGSTQARFMKVLDMNDLNGDIVTDTTCTVADQWYRMGTGYTVLAQQMIHYGYGSADLPDNQGYLYVELNQAAATPCVGKVRLVQANAQETIKYVVAEYNMASTHGSVTNKAMQIALPEQGQFPMVGEDSLLWLEVSMATAGHIVDAPTTHVYVPVTIYM